MHCGLAVLQKPAALELHREFHEPAEHRPPDSREGAFVADMTTKEVSGQANAIMKVRSYLKEPGDSQKLSQVVLVFSRRLQYSDATRVLKETEV